MSQIFTRQQALASTLAAGALIAAAVLFWGTAYKCSLYHLHPEKHARVAVAKLLSDSERPVAKRASGHLRVFSLTAFLALSLLPAAWHRDCRNGLCSVLLSSGCLVTGSRLTSLPHFSFRPPPVPLA